MIYHYGLLLLNLIIASSSALHSRLDSGDENVLTRRNIYRNAAALMRTAVKIPNPSEAQRKPPKTSQHIFIGSSYTYPTTRPKPPVIIAAPTIVVCGGTNFANFTVSRTSILMNAKPFYFKGANWFGFEDGGYMYGIIFEINLKLHGLSATSISAILTLLKTNKFNALRIPLAVTSVISNPSVHASTVIMEQTLIGKRYLDAIALLVSKAAAFNILVVLDMHRLSPNMGISPLWYDAIVTVATVKAAWKVLADMFASQWNVIGADLVNEPHGSATWGTGNNATDWNLGAQDLGNYVLSLVPRWLIIVEGINSASGVFDAKVVPVLLQDSSKLVYSVHKYSAEVYNATYFLSPQFPANMPLDDWEPAFGSLGLPIIVGEYGYKGIVGSDGEKWAKAFVAYILRKKYGSFFWSVNPDSLDTGGLLKSDWLTPEFGKLNLTAVLPSTVPHC